LTLRGVLSVVFGFFVFLIVVLLLKSSPARHHNLPHWCLPAYIWYRDAVSALRAQEDTLSARKVAKPYLGQAFDAALHGVIL